MSNDAIMQLIASGVAAFIGAVIGAVVLYHTKSKEIKATHKQIETNLHIAKQQFNALVISHNRQKWIDNIREMISEIITKTYFIRNIKIHILKSDDQFDVNKLETSEKNQYLSELEHIHFLVIKLELYLNKNELNHTDLLRSAKGVIEFIKSKDSSIEIDDVVNTLLLCSKRVLKEEWERVKKGD